MFQKHIQVGDMEGKVIDIHAHVGVSLKEYFCLEYPYAQTIEGLYYRQAKAGVDVNVIFPFSPDLFFELGLLTKGEKSPAKEPISKVPFAIENRLLLMEVFQFCPELKNRFLPFVSVDPARKIKEQIENLLLLEKEFPFYGIKINPAYCQSKIIELLEKGRPMLEFARERNLSFLLHTTAALNEDYSSLRDTFEVIERNPDLRFCLAHCLGFHRTYLERAVELPNVWVDTAALKIQSQLAFEESPIVAPASQRLEGDYSDHKKIMAALMKQFPNVIIWGSDSPAYSYICKRKQGEGVVADFRLKASYEDEKAALDALPEDLRIKACNTNSIKFIFG